MRESMLQWQNQLVKLFPEHMRTRACEIKQIAESVLPELAVNKSTPSAVAKPEDAHAQQQSQQQAGLYQLILISDCLFV